VIKFIREGGHNTIIYFTCVIFCNIYFILLLSFDKFFTKKYIILNMFVQNNNSKPYGFSRYKGQWQNNPNYTFHNSKCHEQEKTIDT
jgi:hypothetical protein